MVSVKPLSHAQMSSKLSTQYIHQVRKFHHKPALFFSPSSPFTFPLNLTLLYSKSRGSATNVHKQTSFSLSMYTLALFYMNHLLLLFPKHLFHLVVNCPQTAIVLPTSPAIFCHPWYLAHD